MSEVASDWREHFPGGLIGRGCSEQSFLLTPCISRPGDLLAKRYTPLPLHGKLLHGLCFHWLNIFQSAIHSREPWSASLFLQELYKQEWLYLSIEYSCNYLQHQRSWKLKWSNGTEFWDCTWFVKLAHLRFKSGDTLVILSPHTNSWKESAFIYEHQ